MAKLGEVCLLKAGKFVSANDISPEYNKGLYPCFGGNGIRGYVADYTHDGEFPLIGRQGALCGNVNLASGKFHATEHAVVVQPKIEMNVHWLYYALNAMNLGQYATGAAQPGLAVSKLETLSIEIPNISEQNKIAQTLYKVEQLVNFRKQQLAKLDELVKARFVEMFGDLVAPQCEYPELKLVDICADADDIKCGPFGTQLNKDEYKAKGVAIWEIPQINSGFSEMPTHFITEEKAAILNAYSIEPGDIAMSRKGNVGKCGLFPKNLKKGIIHSDVLRIRVDKRKVDSCFMMYQLHFSEAVKRQIEMVSSGAIMAGINVTKLKQIKVRIPELENQRMFAAFVERVDQQKQTVQQSLEKLELMKKALMQEYFG